MELEQLKDGDIVECRVIDNITGWSCSMFDGVFNNKDCTLLKTINSDKFDFNNNQYCGVTYELNVIGNINNYKYNEKEVEFKDIFNYLVNKGLDDLSYRIQDNFNGDIGYFEEYPVNVVEIRDGLISCIMFSRGETQDGFNQDKFNWLYYLKDMKINIQLN